MLSRGTRVHTRFVDAEITFSRFGPILVGSIQLPTKRAGRSSQSEPAAFNRHKASLHLLSTVMAYKFPLHLISEFIITRESDVFFALELVLWSPSLVGGGFESSCRFLGCSPPCRRSSEAEDH